MLKKILRRFSLLVLPFVGALLIRFIYLTSRKRFYLPQIIPDESVIFACWHGDLLMQPYLYYQFRSTPKAKVLISEHFDGQIIAGIIRFFKLGSIHGSTTRGGAKVLIQGLRALEEGYDVGITPDGPKGPRYSIGDGVIIMSQKRHAKVVVFHCRPTRYWQLSSWDRFVVPKPFCTLNFYASEPIDLEGLEMEDARSVIKENLMKYAL